jgi:predicted Zn-dependent protease with MMP-like domain
LKRRAALSGRVSSEFVLDLIGHAYALEVDSGLFDSGGRFEEYVQEALDSLPQDLRAQMSNVEIVVEEERPPGQRLLGLYHGVPLTKRGSNYGAVLPDKITIYRGPLESTALQRPACCSCYGLRTTSPTRADALRRLVPVHPATTAIHRRACSSYPSAAGTAPFIRV